MLPAGRGGRAAAALREALGAGAERRRDLERRAERGRALLRRWDTEQEEDKEEQPHGQSGTSTALENRPSAKELEELELLNRALEKALKVRKSILKTSSEAQGATGQKLAGEGPAPKKAAEQPVPVPVEDVPESTKVRAGSKRPGSSKSHSAYQLRAPYRTDPEVKKSQRKAPASCVSQGPRTAGKSSSKGLASKQGGSHRTAPGSATEGCAPAVLQKTPDLAKSAPDEQQSCSLGDSAGGKNSVAADQELLDAGKESCGFLGESNKKEDTAGKPIPGTPGHGRDVVCAKQVQMQQVQGPVSWRGSRQLWPGRDAAQSWCCGTFLKLLLSEFCSPKPDLSPAEIEEELRVLQDVPSRLRQYVEAEPADHPTLQGEYESLLTLEGLQSTVAQFLQKLQLLRAALECQLRLRPGCTGDVGSCSARCAPARGQACDPAGLLALPLLCYSSCQELRDLFALKLQVSMLHQEVALQKVLMAELLPVLEPRPCPEGCARLFRAIHTQLCQGGSSFPVLVRDELLD